MRLVRSRAAASDIDLARIGAMGFSAGAYLAAVVGVDGDEGQPEASDPVERTSCRPDFLALLYPAVPRGIEDRIDARTPPTFLAQADDDFLPTENSVRFYRALHAAKVPSELHIYARGGHGFGLGVRGGPAASWTARFADWLDMLQIL